MTPDAQGRFCAHCRKSVIDFTSWSDADLYAFFSKNNQSVCGRFQSLQLNRTIQLPVQKPTRLYRIAVALGLGLMFTQLPATPARPKPPLMEENLLVSQELPQNDSTGSDSLVIRGLVLDATKQPAIGAIVSVTQNNETICSAATDIDGNFEMVLPIAADTCLLKIKVMYTGHATVLLPYAKLPKGNVIEMKIAKGVLLGGPMVRYIRPIIDPAHPGANTTFSREQINNMSH